MTVGELLERLIKANPEAEVYLLDRGDCRDDLEVSVMSIEVEDAKVIIK